MDIPGYVERDGFWVMAPTMLQYKRLKSFSAPRHYSVLDQLKVDFSMIWSALSWVGALLTAAGGGIQLLLGPYDGGSLVTMGFGVALLGYLSFNMSKIVRVMRIAELVRVTVPAIEEKSASMAISRGVLIEGVPVTLELHLTPTRAILKEGTLEVEVAYVRGRSTADAISYRRALP